MALGAENEEPIHLIDWENHASPYKKPVHDRWRKHMKAYVEKEILPYVDKWEKNGDIPREAYTKAYEWGVYAAGYPAKYGGTPFEGVEYDPFMKIIFYEQLCRAGSGGIFTSIWVHGIAVPPVLHFGNEEQKEAFRDVITGKKLSCLAISEPNAGSDVRNIKTVGRREGDYFIVTGEKYWISGGLKADNFVTAVRTGGEGIGGISLMIIDRGPGVITTKLPLQGHESSNTAYIVFKDVKVPVKNVIGKINEGFKYIMFNFNQERMGIAMAAVCFSRVLIEESVRYAKTRQTFGKHLIEHQVIRHKLAEMTRLTLAPHALMERVSYQMQSDPLGVKDPSIARNTALFKVQATKTLEYCAREASQIFGGRSYIKGGRGARVDRIYRDVRAYAIYGGSEEIMLDLAIRQAKL